MVCDNIKYTETCNFYRHYSNIRFLILPIYFTVIGALFAAYQIDAVNNAIMYHRVVGGIVILQSFLFWSLEWILNQYISFYRKKLINNFGEEEMEFRKISFDVVPRAMTFIYAGGFVLGVFVVFEGV